MRQLVKFHKKEYPDKGKFKIWFMPLKACNLVYNAKEAQVLLSDSKYNKKSIIYTLSDKIMIPVVY